MKYMTIMTIWHRVTMIALGWEQQHKQQQQQTAATKGLSTTRFGRIWAQQPDPFLEQNLKLILGNKLEQYGGLISGYHEGLENSPQPVLTTYILPFLGDLPLVLFLLKQHVKVNEGYRNGLQVHASWSEKDFMAGSNNLRTPATHHKTLG